MRSQIVGLIFVASVFVWSNCLAETQDANVCSALSQIIGNTKLLALKNPSRGPTADEQNLIDKAKIELLQETTYEMGGTIIDIDNDGKDDFLAWNIEGSGRVVVGEAYEFPVQPTKTSSITLKFPIDLGVLDDPRFVRLNNVNYIIGTPSGDDTDLEISKITKTPIGQYERQTVCRMGTILHAETTCRHPACKKLASVIDDKNTNDSFVNVEWPHKYLAPAGLSAFFPESGSQGDFDNTGNPTSIWRIGREGYLYQYIYWELLGQGDIFPEVDPAERQTSEGHLKRRVLDGDQNARLRRTLEQQSVVLSTQLHREISLPDVGEFFLFDANNRTYWVWDLSEQPFGEEMHITYTNAEKSDYIGIVKMKRESALKPCESDCVETMK